jgi:predicted porin
LKPIKPRSVAPAVGAALLASAGLAAAQQPALGSVPTMQLYGSITAAAVHKSNQAGNTTIKELGNSLLSASFWGLRGSEDLGGGLSAIFRLESPLATDTGSGGSTIGGAAKFWARQSFVGLNLNPAVTITAGRQFHAATDRTIRSLDVNNVAGTSLHTTPLALFGVNRFAGNDGRVDDSLKLRVSGPFGLQGGASVGADDGAGRSWTVEGAHVSPRFTLAAWAAEFKSPGIIAATGKRPRHQLWGAGGNLALGPVRLYLHWIDSDLDATVANRPNQTNRFVHLGANWQAGSQVVVKAAWYSDKGTALNSVVGRNGKKDTTVLSAEYLLSKRSSLHAAVARNAFDGGYKLEPTNIAGLGRDPNASSTRVLTFGLRHDF